MPSEIGLGLSYLRQFDEQNSVTVSASFQNNNYTYDDYKVGLEYNFKDLLYVRGGYLYSPQSSDASPNIFQNYTLGLGVNTKEFSSLDLSVDYAYVPAKYFDANNVFSLRFGF